MFLHLQWKNILEPTLCTNTKAIDCWKIVMLKVMKQSWYLGIFLLSLFLIMLCIVWILFRILINVTMTWILFRILVKYHYSREHMNSLRHHAWPYRHSFKSYDTKIQLYMFAFAWYSVKKKSKEFGEVKGPPFFWRSRFFWQ